MCVCVFHVTVSWCRVPALHHMVRGREKERERRGAKERDRESEAEQHVKQSSV